MVAIGDFNNDAKLDLVVTNYNISTTSVLLGSGNGSFGTQSLFLTGNNPLGVAIADFNTDGKMDFAVANDGATTTSVLLNNC